MIPNKITIDWTLFHDAFSCDNSFSNPDEISFLNKETRALIWVFDDDEMAEFYSFNPAENKYRRDQIEKNPEKYLLIERTSPRDHHQILLSFLKSNWTNNKILKMLVQDCYLGSIGGWMSNVRNNPKISIDPEIVIDFWHRFKNDELNTIMEKWII